MERYIVVNDEMGYYRLIEYGKDLIDKIKVDGISKNEARKKLADRNDIALSDIWISNN